MGEQEQDGRSTALTRKRDTAIEEVGEDAVYGFVEIGLSAREIADTLGLDGSDERVQWSIYNFLQSDAERYRKAKERSVDALAAKANTYSEDPPANTAESKWQNDRSNYWRWLAEMRAGFKKDGITVANFGELYLDALRREGHMNPDNRSRPIEEEPVEVEYELEDGENPRDKYAREQLGEIPDER